MRASWLIVATSLPGTVGAVAAVVWLLAAASGIPAGASGRTLTLSEASAISSHADVARLLRTGADPNAAATVRAGLVGNRTRTVTPMEAATASVRSAPLASLMDAGAIVDERNYPTLWCSAAARGNQDMLHFLESRLAGNRRPAVDCSVTTSVW